MPDTDKKHPFTFEEVQTISDNDRDFVEFVDSTLTARGKLSTNIGILDKSKMMYVPDSLQNELYTKFENRNSILRNYMKTSFEIPENKLIVKTASKDTLNRYKEKANYKIGMSLPTSN